MDGLDGLDGLDQQTLLMWLAMFVLQLIVYAFLLKNKINKKWIAISICLYLLHNVVFLKLVSKC